MYPIFSKYNKYVIGTGPHLNIDGGPELWFDEDMLTQELLKSIVTYNPITGIFTRNSTGLISHCIKDGYVTVSIRRKSYFAHRLAWLYVYGCWPKGQIDHINRTKWDNKINNLRDATPTENSTNTFRSDNPNKRWPCPATATTILPEDFGTGDGIYYRKDRNTYRVRLRIGGRKRVSVGCYKTYKEAKLAYNKAAKELR